VTTCNMSPAADYSLLVNLATLLVAAAGVYYSRRATMYTKPAECPEITCSDFEPATEAPGWHKARIKLANHTSVSWHGVSVDVLKPGGAKVVCSAEAQAPDSYGSQVVTNQSIEANAQPGSARLSIEVGPAGSERSPFNPGSTAREDVYVLLPSSSSRTRRLKVRITLACHARTNRNKQIEFSVTVTDKTSRATA
jgi:hypothetical protein